ncbi:MAG: hypothetical protein OES57_12360 [Acidimicrobiia bacterium]|nr:hypothetical protein [Acidimicrobiia bacterium]
MKRTTKAIIAIATVGVAAGVTAGGVLAASTGDDNEQPITGPALERASAAALAHVGEGTVTETEVGDEDSFYEVEVRLADGSELDVQLDEQFNVVSSETDDPNEADDD